MKEPRFAILKRDVQGQFTKWKKGERVKVTFVKGTNYLIERPRWRKPKLPLCNSCCNVPRSALDFE